MANYNNDELDDELDDNAEEQPVEAGEARTAGGNRNFILALGVLGGIFLLLVIALIIVFMNRQKPAPGPVIDIQATNNVIETANAKTAVAATQAVQAQALLRTPSVTPTATVTPTVTNTSVLAPTKTSAAAGGGALTPTATGAVVGKVDTRTATISAMLTQRAQTSVAGTQQVISTLSKTPPKAGGTPKSGTPTMPGTGFADEVGLPGLFALAAGLIVVIFLVRRLRLTTQ